ncbi:MAG: MOSC domain-containing protein [Chloroflexota bacterium]|nr:MOSC domain-containing protein [Chloroflexota bacterium]MDE2686141.1 MOSC domain-containing protein [Chloroflexota bacterium]
MATLQHLTTEQLEAGLGEITDAPKDSGVVHLIVRRPETLGREVIDEGQLDTVEGLVGDNWKARGSGQTADGSADPECQITIMNSRVTDLVAQDKDRWHLAGDQFYVEMDISRENLPPGTRLAIGDAVLEVSAKPHTGCGKFVERFGADAMKFVNSSVGRELCLRGINTWVIQPGKVAVGDVVRKL